MVAVLVDTVLGKQQINNSICNIGIMSKVVNQTLLEHHIEKFRKAQIEEVIVLTDSKPPQDLKHPNHWKINLSFKSTLSNDDISNNECFLLVTDKSFTDLDYSDYHDKVKADHTPISVAMSIEEDNSVSRDLVRPMIISRDYIKNDPVFLTSGPVRLGLHLLELSNNTYKYELPYKTFPLNNQDNFWYTSKAILTELNQSGRLRGIPITEKLWINADSRVNPKVNINGIVIIGKNSRISKNVTFNGFVIIGDNVVIDENTVVTDSIIMDDTYIGTNINVENSIVNQSSLYKTEHMVEAIGDEDLILEKPGKFESIWGAINSMFK